MEPIWTNGVLPTQKQGKPKHSRLNRKVTHKYQWKTISWIKSQWWVWTAATTSCCFSHFKTPQCKLNQCGFLESYPQDSKQVTTIKLCWMVPAPVTGPQLSSRWTGVTRASSGPIREPGSLRGSRWRKVRMRSPINCDCGEQIGEVAGLQPQHFIPGSY